MVGCHRRYARALLRALRRYYFQILGGDSQTGGVDTYSGPSRRVLCRPETTWRTSLKSFSLAQLYNQTYGAIGYPRTGLWNGSVASTMADWG